MQRLKQFLNQPYPDRDDLLSMIVGGLMAGVIVTAVLYFLKPFNLHLTGDRLLFYCIQFGLISTGVSLIFDGIVRFGLKIRRGTSDWTLWKWVITVSALIVCITMANYVYIVKSFNNTFTVSGFFMVLYSTFLIGVFPVSIFGGVNLIRKLNLNRRIAAAIQLSPAKNARTDLVELPIHNSNKTFSIDLSKVLYIEAMQNYVRIIYKGDTGIEQESLRNTIATIAEFLRTTTIQRCHRSFLVNTACIEKVSGNAQGLKLHLSELDEEEIPVSRKYISLFRS